MTLSPIEYIGSKPRKPKKKASFLRVFLFLIMICLVGSLGYKYGITNLVASQVGAQRKSSVDDIISSQLSEDTTLNKFLKAALCRTKLSISYDPAYFEIPYPMGDIPPSKGVCSDVIIRSYRDIGIDLQRLVIEDMKLNYQSYPKNWGLEQPDPNIDHRRVPNLKNFFTRNGKSLTISQDPNHYKVGDIVTWELSHGAPHIGIVVPSALEEDNKLWIVHNAGLGPRWEDALFNYQITGHFRYSVD